MSAGKAKPVSRKRNAGPAARLERKAAAIRESVVSVSVRNGAGHIAPSLSSVEILVALYYEAMSYRPQEPLWPDRDRLIFSKAHGGYALYAILADLGMIAQEEWQNFYTASSSLTGCLDRRVERGLEAGCGALGHGLPIATGIAFGAKLAGRPYHTFCVVGDGELQEGTNWEAIQFAVKHELGNLTIIVDRNRLQAMDFIRNVLDRDDEDLPRRFRGFGLKPQLRPGHDVAGLAQSLKRMKSRPGKIPSLLLADTVKGRGVRCMEDVAKFHFRIPTDEELQAR